MKALHAHGFPTPTPIDQNRHVILMSLGKGYPLAQVKRLGNPGKIYDAMMALIVRLAEHGTHGAFCARHSA
jgi:RIO kinase 2